MVQNANAFWIPGYLVQFLDTFFSQNVLVLIGIWMLDHLIQFSVSFDSHIQILDKQNQSIQMTPVFVHPVLESHLY